MDLIYKIATLALWQEAEARGLFRGAPIDVTDGYIHFSTKDQARETAAKWFAGQADLMLIGVDPEPLAKDLRWEPSRNGALFPHLYASLPLSAVKFAKPLPLKADGQHDFATLLSDSIK
jgi:uncharacterized protein (DUF952 family)